MSHLGEAFHQLWLFLWEDPWRGATVMLVVVVVVVLAFVVWLLKGLGDAFQNI